MIKFADEFRTPVCSIEGAADPGAGGGGSGGGAPGGGAGGAAAGGGAADPGAGGGAGGGTGGGAAAAAGGDGVWYAPHNFDAETIQWLEERKFPDLGTAMKSGREGSRLASSRNVFEKPDPKNPQGWNGYADLGWTADAEKYGINKPKVEDGDFFDDGEFGVFKAVAHAAKLAPWQAEAVFNGMHVNANKRLRESQRQGAAETQRLTNELKSEWGADFDRNLGLARRAMQWAGAGKMEMTEIEAALKSPVVMRMMHKIGEAMGEDHLVVEGGHHGIGGQDSVAGLDAELNRLMSDRDFRRDFDDPRRGTAHKDAVAKRNDLLQRKAEAELRGRGGRAA